MRAWAALSLWLVLLAPPAWGGSVELEALTSPELRDRIAAGATTVLIPIGGTEQNGPHLVLGKHNRRALLLAQRIAERLGNTLVAPVLAYVPEGSIDPPSEHMRYAGTISIPAAAFEATLEAAARSLHRHGFRDVVLLGDHGGYQASLLRVASRFTGPARVHALPEYYRASQAGFGAILKARGATAAEIGSHAGLADTALALALDPALVRTEQLVALPGEGVVGDPRRASVEWGRIGAEHVVDTTVAVIRSRLSNPR